jgi:hypothetical protein
MLRQPTLLSSCGRAATAGEARFRIDCPDAAPRASRVIALGRQAAAVVHGLAGQRWDGGHFLVFESAIPVNGSRGEQADARLLAAGGPAVLLSDELDDADMVVVIASADAPPPAASLIGAACATRGIMSAGLVMSAGGDTGEVVAALRPNAMVLVVLKDGDDVPEMLAALRV